MAHYGAFRDENTGTLTVNTWAEFRAHIDGTISKRAYGYVVVGQQYRIFTDMLNGISVEVYLDKADPTPPGSDQEDWEQNFLGTARRTLQGVVLCDDDERVLAVLPDAAPPADTPGLLPMGVNPNGLAKRLVTDVDGRLDITGKVSIVNPPAPVGTTPVTLASDTPLAISANTPQVDRQSEYTIPNGQTFTLLSVTAGAEGDSTEQGSRVEVIYVDSGSVEYLVSRLYVVGFTTDVSPDTSTTRSGLTMTGDGVNTKIIIRRIRLSNGTLEVDAVARGYVS